MLTQGGLPELRGRNRVIGVLAHVLRHMFLGQGSHAVKSALIEPKTSTPRFDGL